MSHWVDLYSQIVSTDVCCGCAACVVVCPHHVLDYDGALEKPFQTDEQHPDGCSHGDNGCDICARACPRLDHETGSWRWDWPQLEELLFGRQRQSHEVFGVYRQVVLAQSSDPAVVAKAQDGGIATALLLHGLETGALDGAVVSGYDASNQMTQPRLVKSKEEVLGTARSRYTYAPTPLALRDAVAQKLRKVAMVGVSCEISAAPKMALAGVRKWSNRIALTVGLMCSETFLPEPFLEQTLQGRYGIDMSQVEKVNIKGRVVVTMADGADLEIPLDEVRPMARTWGCPFCPDFSAEHADIALGGLGLEGWCVVVVRTERGENAFQALVDAGLVNTRSIDGEPAVASLLERLAKRQRRRPKNVERRLEGGDSGPFDVIVTEQLHKNGTPEAAFKPKGTADASAVTATVGPSPMGA